ncbi:MAG: hypothetical protein KKA07_03950, partial [Bacteroidetes bacterium]|nr:hypothetical protein [Bacteroidota bacterium]
MFIEKYICSKEDTSEQIRILLTTKFEIDEEYSNDLKEKVLDVHLKEYGDNIYSFIETPYVDKVYRDSYYHYFSSKLHKYDRNCIRVSFFEGEITMADFRNQEGIEALQKKFLGFIVIRPTEPKIIGRSVLSPKIKKERDIAICTVNVSTTVDCIKFHVEGFPHSSQDTETITCAETTIWALMEYFSHKYPEYKPVLPANITETLSLVSSERQIPSTGLDIQQISFA